MPTLTEVGSPLDEIDRLEALVELLTIERNAARDAYRDMCSKINRIKELVRS